MIFTFERTLCKEREREGEKETERARELVYLFAHEVPEREGEKEGERERLRERESLKYLFTHEVPVPVLESRVTKGADDGHANLKLLQLGFNSSTGPHRPLIVRVGKQLG